MTAKRTTRKCELHNRVSLRLVEDDFGKLDDARSERRIDRIVHRQCRHRPAWIVCFNHPELRVKIYKDGCRVAEVTRGQRTRRRPIHVIESSIRGAAT